MTRLCARCPTVETFRVLSHGYRPLSHAFPPVFLLLVRPRTTSFKLFQTVCTTPNQDKILLPPMQSTADEASPSESDRKRARFRNLVQLIRLTTTILNKGKGPKLQSEEKFTSAYASSPYTYLHATARLLVRKDEVIAAVECASFCKDDPNFEFAVIAQPRNVGMFIFCCSLLLRKISPRR